MKNYSLESLSRLIGTYASEGGSVYELIEGTLGLGLTVCVLDGYKSAVIREHPVSQWSSTHTCRFYKVLPKKYQAMIERSAS